MPIHHFNPRKKALDKRLHAELNWDAFKDLREYYRRLKVPSRLCWMAAAQKFPPSDGSPSEVPLTKEIVDALEYIAKIEAENGSYVCDFTLDGSVGISDEEEAAPPEPVSNRDRPPVIGNTSNGEAAPPPPTMGRGGKWKYYEMSEVQDLPATADAWERLAHTVPLGKKANKLDMIDFWADYADTPPEQIDPAVVPNRGCLKYLRLIQIKPAVYEEFMRVIWSKTIPDKKQIDRAERLKDSGATQTRMLDDFDEEFAELHGDAA